MAVKVYRHALTGREVRVSSGSRLAALVEGDKNWSEVKDEKPARRRSRKTDDSDDD